MTARFNLYDFLGYLIPGFTVVLLLAVFLGTQIPWSDLHFLKDFEILASVILFVVSYLLGHLLNIFRTQLRRLTSWGKVRGELQRRTLSTTAGILLAFFRPEHIADLARTHFYSKALLSDSGIADGLEVRAGHRIPQQQLQLLREQLGKTFGLPMTSEADYQAAWSSARAWLAARQASATAELYNSLAAMFRNLAIVFRMAPWVALLALGLAIARAHPFAPTLVWDLTGELVLLAVSWAVLRMSWLLKDQYQLLETLFAKEVLLAFQGMNSPGNVSGGPNC